MKIRPNSLRALIIVTACFALLLSGCGEQRPSESVVRDALNEYYERNLVRFLSDAGLRTGGASAATAFGQKVQRFTVKNTYTRKVAGERIHVYDLEVDVTYGRTETTKEKLSLGLTKRGNAWKWALAEQPERVVAESEVREQEAARQVRESEAARLDAAFREQFK